MSEQARIVIGHGMGGTLVLATDSDWIAQEINDVSGLVDELGIWAAEEYRRPVGVYLWEGRLHARSGGAPSGDDFYTDYQGQTREIEATELASLLAMKPPHGVREEDDRETIQEGDYRYYQPGGGA